MVKSEKEISPRGRAARAGIEAKKRYEKDKYRVYAMEQENRRHLILFRSTNGWWKMGGVSALYYANYIAKRIGRKANVLPDGDFFSKFWTGVVSIKDLDALEEKLKTLKIFRSGRLSSENIKVFDLGFTLEEEMVDSMVHMRENQERQMNTMVMPKNVMPGLYMALLEGLKITVHCNNHMPVQMREQLGIQMAERARTTVVNYLLMAREVANKEEILKKILLSVEMLMGDAKIMGELDVWTMPRCIAAAKEWMTAARLIRKELGIAEEETTVETVKKKMKANG